MSEVLIVDDEVELSRLVARLLSDRGHRATCVCSGEEAVAAVRRRRPDLVLLDLHLGRTSGLDVLSQLNVEAPGAPVVLITAYGSIEIAVKALKSGAADFVTKPFDNAKLLDAIDTLLAKRSRAGAASGVAVVGESPSFVGAIDVARRFARPDVNILLLGETGTGKEVFARTIHAASKRADKPLVAVDCSVLSESLLESELFGHEKGAFTGATTTRIGHFEKAQGGTIFLDEIGNLPLSIQAKLLRVLQERTFSRVGGTDTIHLDVRVISATNADLATAIAGGTFRADIYYRLNEMTITLPPLRERLDDIARMARHFVAQYAEEFGIPPPELSLEAEQALEKRSWPGNVRELKNAMKAAVILANGVIEPGDLPPSLAASPAAAPRPTPVPAPAPAPLIAPMIAPMEVTNPDVRLSFRTRRSTLTLAYVPSLLITPLDHAPRQRLLFHNIRLLESYTLRRTTLSFASNVGFGKVNLRAAGLQAPVTGVAPTDTTTKPAEPNQTTQDPNATPGTPTTPTTPGMVTPGTPTQPGQAQLVDQVVQHITWSSTLSLAHNLTRRWTLGSFVGYSIDGGLDAASTKAYPLTRGSSVGASSTYTYLLTARHSFITSLNAQQLWSSNNNNVAALLGTENWVHVITPRTRNTAGAGMSVTRFSQANGTVGVSIFPTFNATVSHEASLARGFLDLSAGAYAAPALDPVRATVDPRLGTSAVVRWSNKHFAAAASGNAAISVARTQDNAGAIDSVNGSLILTYSIVDGFLVDGGVRAAARRFRGVSSIPPSWAGFVGVTFAYERLLNGSR